MTDIFGCQFGIKNDDIIKFDPEVCEIEFFASDLDEWACNILENYEVETGYLLASEWQKINKPIKEGKRLIPKIPFVLGSSYDIEIYLKLIPWKVCTSGLIYGNKLKISCQHAK